ncbi:MAG TPA: molecular chaperone TorD family protein [Syntrophales bacterium]|nr:molecular chaperone TorD family protein [Syntrophales bacterium]
MVEIDHKHAPVWLSPYGDIRAESYLLIASLLGQQPSEGIRELLQNLEWDEVIPERLNCALRALRQAGRDYTQAAMEVEFSRLFVAPGRSSMMPYASWYREKKIQARTLAVLRSDLIRLGIVKQEGNPEPEDHVCALCEIMSLLCQGSVPYDDQARFFHQHISPWMKNFFWDLQAAKNADFYRAVGSFGARFLEAEGEYLKYAATAPRIKPEGGLHDENGISLQPADIH